MKTTLAKIINRPRLKPVRLVLSLAAVALLAAVPTRAQQTAVITPILNNYWGGAYFTNQLVVGSNVMTLTGGTITAPVGLVTPTGLPAGVGVAFSPSIFTNSNTGFTMTALVSS